MHYLIIEDDEGMCELLQSILRRLEDDDCHISVLRDGDQAWVWLDRVESGEAANLPDIAFIDLKMPGPQGHEVSERMRQIPVLQQTGIVLMSATELTQDEFDGIMARSGADRFIHKPLPGVKGINLIIKEIMEVRRNLSD